MKVDEGEKLVRGSGSPLYHVFAAENSYGMDLKPGVGSEPDELNTVWVMDSAEHPFYDGEVYHQAHCDFSMSSGMPYPSTYHSSLWEQHQQDGGAYGNHWAPTGCPETHGSMSHPGFLCQ